MGSPAVEVLIRGAGPVGCTLALALRAVGRRCAIVERGGSAAPNFRPIALSYASRLILEKVGAWSRLAPTAIESIRVSQTGAFGRTHLDAADAGVPALGYVVEYGELREALRAGVRDLLVAEDLPAACVVHAEGASAEATEKPYAQSAVVAVLDTEPPAQTTAFERFTAEGPLALLPHAGRYALVWSASPERAAQLAVAPQAEFLAALAESMPARAGRPIAVHARSAQPLGLRVRPARVAEREVFVGNAAQTLHPVAGQGLNLGLRDAWDLAAVLGEAADPGDAAVLSRYAARRRLDAAATIRATDFLARSFVGARPLPRAMRGLALAALDVLPPARRFFARRMIFGPSAMP